MEAGEIARDQVPGTGYLCQAEKGKPPLEQWGIRGALTRGVAQMFALEGSLWLSYGRWIRERPWEGSAGGKGGGLSNHSSRTDGGLA